MYRKLLLVAFALMAADLQAKDWDTAPALANPAGTNVVNVSTVAQLESAFNNLVSNDLIVVASGTYQLTGTLGANPTSQITNIGIRGTTGDPNDVVITGDGMYSSTGAQHGIFVGNVDGMLIADVTIQDVYNHPVFLTAESSNVHFYNCKFLDAGEQFIKGTSGGYPLGSDYGVVEYCYFAYTTQGSTYTNGIDIHGGTDWIIRHNHFLRCNLINSSGSIGPVILMWNGSSGTIVEGNTFIDCETAIAFGLGDKDNAVFPYEDHRGGIIRNNFIHRSTGASGVDSPDCSILIWDSPDTKCINNTIIQNGTYNNGIEYRFDTINAEIRNNLLDCNVVDRGSGTSSNTVTNNTINASISWFVNPSQGDLQLNSTATSAIDQASVSTSVTDDYLGNSRGSSPDLGAHEFNGTPANQAPVASASYTGTAQVTNTITLDGTASSDPDSGPSALTYLWTQTSGPSVTITNASSATASFTPTVVGTYVFQLLVGDSVDTDTDIVSVSVIDPALTITTSNMSLSLTDGSTLPASVSRQLTYGGTGTLTVSVSSSQTWLTVSFDNGGGGNTLTAGNSGTITASVVSLAGLSKGNYTATITIDGDDGVSHQVQIDFDLTYQSQFSQGGSGGSSGGCAANSNNIWLLVALLAMIWVAIIRRNPAGN